MATANLTPREKILAELARRGVVIPQGGGRGDSPGLAAFVRKTVNFSLHDWQERFLCPLLERAIHEKGIRAAIHAPPGYGKSIIVSQRFPAWLFGLDPTHKFALACYNETRAMEFGEVCKGIILSPQYREMFPHISVRQDAAAGRFSTVQRASQRDGQPSFQAMGLLSGFVGRHPDTLVVDDPYKSYEEAISETINEKVWRWWQMTGKVRIAPESNVFVMFHRYHEDDFAGRLIAEGFEYHRFPAEMDENEDGSDHTGRQIGELLSPMRSREFLDAVRDAEPKVWMGQFQGRPRPFEGAFFEREWLRTGHIPPLSLWVRFWDLATSVKKTGDYTAGALCGIGPDQWLYLKDMIRFRAEWPEVYEHILTVTRNDAAECQRNGARYVVGVDARLSQQGFFQQLMRAPIFSPEDGSEITVPLWPQRSTLDKKELASGWAALARSGGFRMALNPTWNQAFIDEAIAFDGLGLTHDDQIDAVSGAYELLWALIGQTTNEDSKVPPGSRVAFDKLIERQRKARPAF